MEQIPLPPEFMSDELRELAKSTHYDVFVTRLHFSLGMKLRNALHLWDPKSPAHKWFVEHGVHHADDMSSLLMLAVWHQLRGEEPAGDLWRREVDRFRRHWQRWDPKGMGRLYGPPGRF